MLLLLPFSCGIFNNPLQDSHSFTRINLSTLLLFFCIVLPALCSGAMDKEGGGVGGWDVVKRTPEKDFWKPTMGLSMDDQSTSEPLKITFRDPAKHWTDGLPIGNGRFGAMIWGGVDSEILNLNEDTLWTGVPGNYTNPNSLASLAKVRKLVDAGNYSEATLVATNELQGKGAAYYQPLGDLKLDFDTSNTTTYTNETYSRELDLHTATVTVHYSIGTTDFTREHFASFPDQVIVTRISSTKPGSVSFTASFASQLTHTVHLNGKNQIVMEANCRGISTASEEEYVKANAYGSDQGGIRVSTVLDVRIGGSGGVIRSLDDEKKLRVEGCDWVVLILAAATNFDGAFTNPSESKKDPTALAMNTVKGVTDLGYSDLYKRHLDDYQALFHRVSLQLSNPKNTKAIPMVTTTAERVKSFPTDEDPSLITLMFQYGRYLLISSSRPGTQPANLQGIWTSNDTLSPPWGCVPHLNINLQMNYWQSHPCNLQECQQPLFDFIQTLTLNGAKTTKTNYNASGWVTHSVTDLWGKSDPDAGNATWAQWQMGGAWISTHLWEHYTYTMDKEFLKEVAYPIIKGSAEFLLDWLIEGRDGYLETNPSTSPEHQFYASDGKISSVSYSTTMDMEIIREIFSTVLTATEILGKTNDDDEKIVQRILKAQPHLPPVRISDEGTILEWAEDFKDAEVEHRHISHLFGIFPGHTITLDKNPDLCAAAEKTLYKRGEKGPGWSTVWKTAVWARLRNSDHAYTMVKRLFELIEPGQQTEGGVYANLFTAHPPFQIDSNFGFSSAVAEMLVQSTVVDLYLLPAMPKGKWVSGCAKGLKARGGIRLSLCWEEGEMTEVQIFSELSSGKRRVHYGGKMVEVEIMAGKIHTFDKDLNTL